jgi:hypothetical protein
MEGIKMDFFRFLLKIIHHTAAAKRGVAIYVSLQISTDRPDTFR